MFGEPLGSPRAPWSQHPRIMHQRSDMRACSFASEMPSPRGSRRARPTHPGLHQRSWREPTAPTYSSVQGEQTPIFCGWVHLRTPRRCWPGRGRRESRGQLLGQSEGKERRGNRSHVLLQTRHREARFTHLTGACSVKPATPRGHFQCTRRQWA